MSKVQTHPLNMVCGNTYVFSKNSHEYTSELESIKDGKITFANEQTFDVDTTTTIFYECRVDGVEKLLDNYELALGSIKMLNLTKDFEDAVSAIIENTDALREMCKHNDTFKEMYDMHYVKHQKNFKQPCWTPFTSMCQSLIMYKYH